MYPLKMKPSIKYLIWGGTQLKQIYHKDCTADNAGESWELSTHPAGESVVANGAFAGQSLVQVLTAHPEFAPADFPLLFKLIDANRDLSIQVHPDDAYARAHENSPRGKTEMWYIIDAKPGAKIGYGWKRDMTAQEVRAAVQNGALEQEINYIPVSAGEAYFIPAGTVHCLCEGLLVAEIQQNSNTTYRLYDYQRKDKEGKLRPLHLEESLAVANLHAAKDAKPVSGENVLLAQCPYFSIRKYTGQTVSRNTDGHFHIVFCVSGQGQILSSAEPQPITAGDTYLIPANLGAYTVQGDGVYLVCTEQEEAE